MASELTLVINGNLLSDGTIQLDRPPPISPGRVQITMRSLSQSEAANVCIPDGPWLDEAVSAPFDLPFAGVPRRVHPRQAHDLLPDPLPGDEDAVA